MRIIRLLVNWALLLTLPVWGGPVMFAFVISTAFDENKYDRAVTRAAMRGERWLLEKEWE